MGACNCDCYNELMAELDEDGYVDKINRVNSEPIKHNESKLMAADLWFSDGTASTLTQIKTYGMPRSGCDEGHVNLTIKNAKIQPFIKYQEKSEEVMAKLRDVNTCLKTLCFMLKQYTLPDEKNNIAKFETTQDMARYFKIMADMCLKASEFE